MEKKIIVAVATLFVALTPLGRTAQAQSPSATVRGTAVVAEGTPAAGALVTVVSRTTASTRTTHTDPQGRFVVTGLRPGPYELTVTLAGYAPRRQEDLRLDASATVTLRLELAHAVAADTLTIAPLPHVIEPTRAHEKEVISEAELVNLPIRERDAIDLVSLTPGAYTFPFGGFSIAPGTGDSSIVVDGTDRSSSVNWPGLLSFRGLRRYPFALESIQQIVVNTSSYPAAYGGTEGGAIQVVTKSGGNDFNGSLFLFAGNDADYKQGGGTLGGPLQFDHHFFFGSFDARRRTSDQGGAPSFEEDITLVRTDHQFGPGTLTARYNGDRIALSDARRDRRLHVSGGVPLGGKWFEEARAQYGTERAMPGDPRVIQLQVGDTVTFASGAHLVSTGVDADRRRLDADALAFMPAITTYSWFAQDQWMVTDATTIDAGVRLDGERTRGWFENESRYVVGPRLGIAWSPGPRRLAVRGGYGLFRRAPQVLDVLFGGAPLGSVNDFMHQASAGVEWEWMPHLSLGTSYQHVQGDLPGLQVRYDAVTYELLRRYAQGVHYRVAYTYGRQHGQGAAAAESFPGHHLALDFVYETGGFAGRVAGGRLEPILKDWTVSGIYHAQTGTPTAFASIDPRVARNIRLGGDRRLSLIWESYDLTNRPNYRPVTVGGRIGREPATRRVMQVAARLAF